MLQDNNNDNKPPMGRKKRKPDQDQHLQFKQLKGDNTEQGRQNCKMYYNSNSRRLWPTNKNPIPSTTNNMTTNFHNSYYNNKYYNSNKSYHIENKHPVTTKTTTPRTSPAKAQSTTTPASSTTKNDNMQRRNSNNNNNNNKRYPQKYSGNGNGNLATTEIMTTTGTTNYASMQSHQNKNTTRKSRYNKRQDQQKRNNCLINAPDSKSSPSWLKNSFGHHFVVTSSSVTSSSCIEEKFLVTHNPGHRNSTSSEETVNSEDLNSSREQFNKSKIGACNSNHGNNSNNNNNSNKKSRAKRQAKPPAKAQVKNQQLQQQQQQQQPQQEATKSNKSKSPGTVAGSGNGKWRQVNAGNHQQQQQQHSNQKQRSHQQKKKNDNNLSNKKLHNRQNAFNSSSGNSSCSSSALSSPTNSPAKSKQLQQQQSFLNWSANVNFQVPPLQQFEQMEMEMSDAHALVMQQLRRHVIADHLLRVYGFPVESVVHDGAIEIFKCLPPHLPLHLNLVEAAMPVTVINSHDGLTNTGNQNVPACSSSSLSSSCGTDSGNSSPRNLDSESSSAGDWSGSECTADLELDFCTSESSSSEEEEQRTTSLAKECTRCTHLFLVDEQTGEYLTQEECCYHEGKYQHYAGRWNCCQEPSESSPGCRQHDYHVWAGSVTGINGPYHDFVRTTHRAHSDDYSVYALDCEMSYTARGLDVTKVSLVALNGQLIYEQYVQPDCQIVDFNTRYSGITEKDLHQAKSLAQVQRDLLEIISADTILIGHGLDNDLRALRIVHNTLIDTSISFPHASGFPYRRALRHLTKMHLKREIQSGDGTTGHSSFEDSRACMELMLWRVRRELLDPNWCWED